jgi:hypothetical protein
MNGLGINNTVMCTKFFMLSLSARKFPAARISINVLLAVKKFSTIVLSGTKNHPLLSNSAWISGETTGY